MRVRAREGAHPTDTDSLSEMVDFEAAVTAAYPPDGSLADAIRGAVAKLLVTKQQDSCKFAPGAKYTALMTEAGGARQSN